MNFCNHFTPLSDILVRSTRSSACHSSIKKIHFLTILKKKRKKKYQLAITFEKASQYLSLWIFPSCKSCSRFFKFFIRPTNTLSIAMIQHLSCRYIILAIKSDLHSRFHWNHPERSNLQSKVYSTCSIPIISQDHCRVNSGRKKYAIHFYALAFSNSCLQSKVCSTCSIPIILQDHRRVNSTIKKYAINVFAILFSNSNLQNIVCSTCWMPIISKDRCRVNWGKKNMQLIFLQLCFRIQINRAKSIRPAQYR